MPSVPFEFGYAIRASGDSQNVPGAVRLTWLDSRSEDETQHVRNSAHQVAVTRLMSGDLSASATTSVWVLPRARW
jgi:hypothetical protein